MSRYKYRMPWGETLEVEADLTQAQSQIRYTGDEGELIDTPYQTADVQHRQDKMLEVIVAYFGPDYYCPSDCCDAECEHYGDAVRGANKI